MPEISTGPAKGLYEFPGGSTIKRELQEDGQIVREDKLPDPPAPPAEEGGE